MAAPTTFRALRERAGLTQEALSERCSEHGAAISQGRISEYESGRFPRSDKAAILAKALGVTPERLYAALLASRAQKVAA